MVPTRRKGTARPHRVRAAGLDRHWPQEAPRPFPADTHNLFSLSFSLIFLRTLISSRAASRYLPTLRMIFRATWDFPLDRGRKQQSSWEAMQPLPHPPPQPSNSSKMLLRTPGTGLPWRQQILDAQTAPHNSRPLPVQYEVAVDNRASLRFSWSQLLPAPRRSGQRSRALSCGPALAPELAQLPDLEASQSWPWSEPWSSHSEPSAAPPDFPEHITNYTNCSSWGSRREWEPGRRERCQQRLFPSLNPSTDPSAYLLAPPASIPAMAFVRDPRAPGTLIQRPMRILIIPAPHLPPYPQHHPCMPWAGAQQRVTGEVRLSGPTLSGRASAQMPSGKLKW